MGAKANQAKRRRQRIPASEDVHLQPDLGQIVGGRGTQHAASSSFGALRGAEVLTCVERTSGKKGLILPMAPRRCCHGENRDEGGFLRTKVACGSCRKASSLPRHAEEVYRRVGAPACCRKPVPSPRQIAATPVDTVIPAKGMMARLCRDVRPGLPPEIKIQERPYQPQVADTILVPRGSSAEPCWKCRLLGTAAPAERVQR